MLPRSEDKVNLLGIHERAHEKPVRDQSDGGVDTEGCDPVLCVRRRETKSTLSQHSILQATNQSVYHFLQFYSGNHFLRYSHLQIYHVIYHFVD